MDKRTKAELASELEKWQGLAETATQIIAEEIHRECEADEATLAAARKSPAARIVAALKELESEGITRLHLTVGNSKFFAQVTAES